MTLHWSVSTSYSFVLVRLKLSLPSLILQISPNACIVDINVNTIICLRCYSAKLSISCRFQCVRHRLSPVMCYVCEKATPDNVQAWFFKHCLEFTWKKHKHLEGKQRCGGITMKKCLHLLLASWHWLYCLVPASTVREGQWRPQQRPWSCQVPTTAGAAGRGSLRRPRMQRWSRLRSRSEPSASATVCPGEAPPLWTLGRTPYREHKKSRVDKQSTIQYSVWSSIMAASAVWIISRCTCAEEIRLPRIIIKHVYVHGNNSVTGSI